jgi:hypothetical protein
MLLIVLLTMVKWRKTKLKNSFCWFAAHAFLFVQSKLVIRCQVCADGYIVARALKSHGHFFNLRINLRILPHGISVPFAASHIVFETASHF